MSVWLCFFSKQNITTTTATPTESAASQVSCELLPNECKFELSKLKLFKNKLLPEARKRLRSIQSELNTLSKPRSIVAGRVECLHKIQVILIFLGITIGGYILAVGEGMALLVTTVLISIAIYLMSLFIWHWNISGFQRDVESLFVKENEKYSQSLQLNWTVLPNCQAIVVSYDYHGSTKRQEKGEENKQSEELKTQEEEVIIEINDLGGFPRKNDRQKSFVKQNIVKEEKDNKEQRKHFIIQRSQKSDVILPTGESEENNTNQDFQITTEGNQEDHKQQNNHPQQKLLFSPSQQVESPHGFFSHNKEQFQDTYIASTSIRRKEVDELTPPDSPEIQTLEEEMSEKPALKRNSLLGKRNSEVSAKRASLQQNSLKRESLKKQLQQQPKQAEGEDEEESMEFGGESEDEKESHEEGRMSNEEEQDKKHGITEEVAEIDGQLESELSNPMTGSKQSKNLMDKF